MRVALFQNILGDLLVMVKEVKGEVEEEYIPQIQQIIAKKYPILSNFKVLKVYMKDDYTFLVQLHEPQSNLYTVIEL